jgi:NSS family neurotransmitter:Na+ symporter
MARRGAWATRFGIYLAAIGSAFGLGGLWRFPYVVSENGGGAFVILYFFLMIFLGMPLLIGELLIGKVTRRGVLAGQRQLVAQAQSRGTIDKRRWLIRIMPLLAGVALFCCVAILGYYSVVSGWVLHFLVQFWSLSVGDGVMSPLAVSMIQLKDSGMLQLFLASMHIVAVSVIVAKGVEDGIEKWVGFVMPIFVIILSVLVVKSLNMSSSGNAIRYLLYPDFSKLNIRSLGAAVGQLCFTLSVGFACMVTFGSYLRDAAIVPSTGFRVATFDSATALIAGFLVFPLVIGGSGELKGPELLFNSVPGFLLKLDGGIVFGIFFFLCLYMAALGASISLFETLVANICENSHLSRGRASLLAGLATIISSIVPALSSTVFKDVLVGGHNLFEFIDFVLIDWIVPIVALVFSQIVVYEVNEKMKVDEFAGLEGASRDILYTQWSILMKWVVPSVIVFALILQFVGLFQH